VEDRWRERWKTGGEKGGRQEERKVGMKDGRARIQCVDQRSHSTELRGNRTLSKQRLFTSCAVLIRA
jgi:hypothetical protein